MTPMHIHILPVRILSRTADHLFRMSRHTERADKRSALATQQRQPAQQARGFLPEEESC